ncbi:MAG: zinc ribbon domain-containing protein [Rhodocyclaceae bacterium]|nr:zinc ribbon domain-containing protein [Rhodocyclaceae bacterium]
MPIYAYRCTSCGFEKDVMQKVSEPKLSTCPQCKTENFAKQLTAPGFQLKGTGWYATDFKGGTNAKTSVTQSDKSADSSGGKTESANTKTDGVSPAPTGASSSVSTTPSAPSASSATASGS